jgi:hypothetical protein
MATHLANNDAQETIVKVEEHSIKAGSQYQMRKSDINPMPPNFAKYIDLVADVGSGDICILLQPRK